MLLALDNIFFLCSLKATAILKDEVANSNQSPKLSASATGDEEFSY